MGLSAVPLPMKKPNRPDADAIGADLATLVSRSVDDAVDVARLDVLPRRDAAVASPLPAASQVAKPRATASEPPVAAAARGVTAIRADVTPAAGAAVRFAWRRAGALVDLDDGDAVAPVAPAEPVSSANATGIAAIAEPTPNATASTPTRPINRE